MIVSVLAIAVYLQIRFSMISKVSPDDADKVINHFIIPYIIIKIMASGSDWSFEKVRIRDSDYSAKCGITGECYFWVSKGFIKITQVDNKTSVTYSVTKIRCVAEIFARYLIILSKKLGSDNKNIFPRHGSPRASGTRETGDVSRGHWRRYFPEITFYHFFLGP